MNVRNGAPALTTEEGWDPDPHRLCLLWITPELFVDLFKPGVRVYEVVENALPEDARLTRSFYSAENAAVGLIIHSRTFGPIPPGCVIPELCSPTVRLAR